MWRNYLAAALHNLFRNRAYAAINILGLAIGLATAILIVLFVRDELSYDSMYPDADRIYRLSMNISGPQSAFLANADGRFGPAMKLDFPEVESATRLKSGSGYLSHGGITVWSDYRRADPEFFEMFPPRTIVGDPDAALKQPGQLVITRSFANHLFGRVDVVGQPVDLRLNQTSTVNVGAVIEDPPSNTHFRYDVIASTIGEREDNSNAKTYVRFRPGTDIRRMRAALPDIVRRHFPFEVGGQPAWKVFDLKLTALRDVHFLPPSIGDMAPPSDRRTVDAFVVIGILTLLISAANFISMMTARAARRATEVGVRKGVGATRGQIALQFVAEGLFYGGLSLAVALVAVDLLLPALNGFLQRKIRFDYVNSGALGLGVLGIWLAVATAASAYPATVLSRFRPATVLKGVLSLPGGPGHARNVLVVLQFAVLVALVISTITIQRQTRFAIEDQLRVPGDQVFVMRAPCQSIAFQDVARRIPGVRRVSCASDEALGQDLGAAHFASKIGEGMNLNGAALDRHFFDIFDIKPLAGRLFDAEHGEDNTLLEASVDTNPALVLNESGARALGYANPVEAVGKTPSWSRGGILASGLFGRTPPQPSQIVGVVPDFSAGSIRTLIQPSAYYIDPRSSFVLVLSLDGKRIPDTMRAIEAAWKVAASGRPMVGGQFLSQMFDSMYTDLRRQTRLFATFSAVAIVVAALGLLGLAVFTAEQRTREIGVRKCLGASRGDILRFIGWQFARPVLLSNLIAWPVAWFFMQRWLEGFAYHVDIGALAFLGASVGALVIAVFTVTGHALLVSRTRPVEALRYE